MMGTLIYSGSGSVSIVANFCAFHRNLNAIDSYPYAIINARAEAQRTQSYNKTVFQIVLLACFAPLRE